MNTSKKFKIGIIGLGYVGFISGVGFALKGFDVKCVEINKETIELANNGKVPFYEPKLEENLQTVLKNKKFEASDDYSLLLNTDMSFICVGTPSHISGEIDLTYIKNSAKELGGIIKQMEHFHIVIIKSTVVPGTTENVILPILEKTAGKKCGIDFSIAMNPEFLKEGNAMDDFLNPDRTVVGAYDVKTADKIKQLYDEFKGTFMIVRNPRTAEMIKYANNSFLATKISFINEIANICRLIGGIEVNEVAKGIGLDYRISENFLRAGCGFGGSCFPKDVKAIISHAKKYDYDPKLLESVIDVNTNQAMIMVKILQDAIGDLNDRMIAILGLSFKPNTSDMREAPSIRIIKRLKEEGVKIQVYDPVAIEEAKKIINNDIEYCESVKECIKNADACLLVTEWEEFKKLSPEFFIENMKTPIIIDGRKIYDFDLFTSKLKYYTIGLK